MVTGDGIAPDPTGLVGRLRATFDAGTTRPLRWRREQLRALRRLLTDRTRDLLLAVSADLGKPETEGRLTEVSFVVGEIDRALRELDRWARPERVPVPLVQRPGRAEVVPEPLGVVLVIAPWNYPVHLLLAPTVAAIAAGNCVVAKPSEVAPATSATLARLIPRYLDPDAVAVVEGGAAATQELLAQRFDHIFYTGNARVGRVVMEAAARHLTPVTLELGGKSPALVGADADLEVAARRIVWGKFLNAGQTCVAPDYVLVERSAEDRLVSGLADAIRRFYGPEPARSPDYARIVNAAHWRRLTDLLEASKGTVAAGGEGRSASRYLAPTLLRDVGPDDPVMEEEIFGPILPVIAVDDLDEGVALVRARPAPLALYVFARSRATVSRIISSTSSGGVCVNGTVLQLAVPDLPFGGVGQSGMGAYHGQAGFETFSHRRAVLSKPVRPDPPVAYPPYTRLRRLLLRLAG